MGVMLSCIARGHHGYKQLSSHRGQVPTSTSTLPVIKIQTPQATLDVTTLQVASLEVTVLEVAPSKVTTPDVR
jgi:hypothetical protein